MTDETSAPAGGESDAAPVIVPGNAGLEGDYSPEQAFADYQKKFEPAAESADTAAAETELSGEDNAAPRDADHGEDEGAAAVEEPPIARPKSWSQDEDAEWEAIPRARQEKIAASELARDADRSRKLNEVAEIRKAVEAEREAVAQDRKALAAKLPEVERAVQEFLSHKYPDIKSMDDVARMANDAARLWPTDPFTAGDIGARLKAWEVDQQRIALSLADARAAQAGEARERELNLLKYRADETTKLAEFVPAIKNPDELKALTTKAVNHLKSFEFTDQAINEYAAQGEKPFIFSAGFQRILLNSLKYEEMKGAPLKAIPKPVQAVQRPGVAAPRGNTDAIQASRSKLTSTGSVDDAYALYQAKQKARA